MYNSQRSLSISSFATHPLSEDPPGHVQQTELSFYLLFCDSPFIRGSSRSGTIVSALFLSPLLRLTLYQRILQVRYNSQRSLSFSSFATHPLSEDPPGHVQQAEDSRTFDGWAQPLFERTADRYRPFSCAHYTASIINMLIWAPKRNFSQQKC